MKRFLLVSLLAAGCQTPGRYEQAGTASGALLGGVVGGVIGNNVGDGNNQVLGAAIGAAIGALAGQQYGQRQDNIDARMAYLENQSLSVSINVNNSNGSFTPVQLRRVGSTWIGPRGEVYQNFPSEQQLKPIYGF